LVGEREEEGGERVVGKRKIVEIKERKKEAVPKTKRNRKVTLSLRSRIITKKSWRKLALNRPAYHWGIQGSRLEEQF